MSTRKLGKSKHKKKKQKKHSPIPLELATKKWQKKVFNEMYERGDRGR